MVFTPISQVFLWLGLPLFSAEANPFFGALFNTVCANLAQFFALLRWFLTIKANLSIGLIFRLSGDHLR
ncbi:hypothetical protein D0C16_15385 [Cellvibrio sp. KY-GH-1]|nr:hypothetical protein D0C16_15385 [Cellvibrio sp. KY-GH-1]